MSSIMDVHQVRGNGGGSITCEARLLDYREQAVPGAYSYIAEGVAVPVMAGDVYDIWEFSGIKCIRNKVFVSGHGEMIGPLVFTKCDSQELYAMYAGKVSKRLHDYGIGIGFSICGAGIVGAIFALVMSAGIGLHIFLVLAIALLLAALVGTFAGLAFGSEIKNAPFLDKVTIKSVVPENYQPQRGRV